jgi:rhodanese-related sulfurtransferase
LLLVATAGLLAAVVVSCGDSAGDQTLETVSPTAASEVLATNPDAILLDIRTPEEYASERIADAENIDFYAPDFSDQLASLDPDETYVVYCRSGNRTDSAMDVFDDLGFAVVYEVEGGIVGWVGAGLPILE